MLAPARPVVEALPSPEAKVIDRLDCRCVVQRLTQKLTPDYSENFNVDDMWALPDRRPSLGVAQ